MKMKPHLLTCIGILFFVLTSFSQTAPEIEWQNTIGGASSDILTSIQQTSDNGYIAGGYSYSGHSGDKSESSKGGADYWIIKLDVSGNIQWQKTIGGSNNEDIYSLQQTPDNGYLLGGWSTSGISGDKTEANIGGADIWIVKLDSTGNIMWQNSIGGTGNDYINYIEPTPDNGYIVAANSNSGIGGDKTEIHYGFSDYWVIKLDSAGNMVWQNTIGGDKDDYLRSIKYTEDGGYFLGGYSMSTISGEKTASKIGLYDYWIMKLDSLGNILWQKTIGGGVNDEITSMIETYDHNYILAGVSNSGITGNKTEASRGEYDYWIVKVDTAGNILWQKTIGGNEYDILLSIDKTSDCNYILGGYSESSISGEKTQPNSGLEDYWLIKIDESGNIIWQSTIGGSGSDYLWSLKNTFDGGYIAGGYSSSGISGDKSEANIGFTDYWIIKLHLEEIICSVTSSITPADTTTFCVGGNVTLNAPVDSSYTYQWKKNGVNISGATSSSFTANNTGNYQVYISNGSCDDLSDSLLVVKNPKPASTITNLDATNDLCFDSSIKLKANGGLGYSWQWYKGATAISGAASAAYLATTIGNYKVKVTNSFGCFKM
ncbi:MAG: hypothetical protein H7Y00_03625, partial [Fimbriimonadaceae bacterium]|nr:hypothetical protein [Chitinophagales bacterium]